MLHGDAQWLDREVAHYKVAAMEVAHFLDHLEEGSLVITPGDRSDIIIGTLIADAATSYPGVAGVILTGGFRAGASGTASLRRPETFPCAHPLCEGRHLCNGDNGDLPASSYRPGEPEERSPEPLEFSSPMLT